MQACDAILAGEIVVLFLDETRLLHDDARGYIWSRVGEPAEIDMKNFRDRQSYFGALEQCEGEMIIMPSEKADGVATVRFMEQLCEKYEGKRLYIFWDGASYHDGEEMREYLQKVNGDLPPEQWKITCTRFEPHAPEQNPIEDVWLYAKRFIRNNWFKCDTFRAVKGLFMEALKDVHFSFDKLFSYAHFLELI